MRRVIGGVKVGARVGWLERPTRPLLERRKRLEELKGQLYVEHTEWWAFVSRSQLVGGSLV